MNSPAAPIRLLRAGARRLLRRRRLCTESSTSDSKVYTRGQGTAAGGWQLPSSDSDSDSSAAASADVVRVVLVEPCIPGNVGTTARTCAASGVPLHLVEPLGFEITDKRLKRAGLDYWDQVCASTHPEGWQAFVEGHARPRGGRIVAFSSREEDGGVASCFTDVAYEPGDWLCFGSEPSGLPADFVRAADVVVAIPQVQVHVRSLNLAVATGIGLYEALRQLRGGGRPGPGG